MVAAAATEGAAAAVPETAAAAAMSEKLSLSLPPKKANKQISLLMTSLQRTKIKCTPESNTRLYVCLSGRCRKTKGN